MLLFFCLTFHRQKIRDIGFRFNARKNIGIGFRTHARIGFRFAVGFSRIFWALFRCGRVTILT